MKKTKYFNSFRLFFIFFAAIGSVITIPISSVLISFLYIFFTENIAFFELVTIFWTWDWEFIKSYFIYVILIVILIHFLAIFIYIHFKGNVKSNKLVTEAEEKAHGRASWIINEYENENQLSKNDKKRKYELKVFERNYTKNFDVPSYITRTEFNSKTKVLNVWGVPFKKAVHSITIGSTGSGKTERIIYFSAFINSKLDFEKKPCMVFSDPKGELYQNLSKTLEKNGYETTVLNLRNPMYSNSWNPLSNIYKFLIESLNFREKKVIYEEIHSKVVFDAFVKKTKCKLHKEKSCKECIKEVEEKTQNYIADDIVPDPTKNELTITFKEISLISIDNYWIFDELMAEEIISGEIEGLKNLAYGEVNDLSATLLDPGEDKKNKQWYDGAQGLFKGFIFAMMEMMEEDIESITEEQFNIITVATHLSNKEALKTWFKKWAKNRETKQSVISAAKVLNTSEQSMGNFFSIVSTALALFEGSELRTLLCKNTIDLFNFVTPEKPKAIFMIVPDDRKDRHPLASLFVSQLYKSNVFKAGQNLIERGKEELDRDVVFYLDEFGNFPAIVNFSTILTVSRGRRMFFNMILQSLEQLDTVYGKSDAETIKANCLLTVYLRSPSFKTHEEISTMCGKTTIKVRSSSPNIDPKTKKKTYNYTLQPKQLIEPSDIKLIFDEPEENKKASLNKYAIVLYQDAQPSLITYEYFFTVKKYLGVVEVEGNLPINRSINFEKDYYKNVFEMQETTPKRRERPHEENWNHRKGNKNDVDDIWKSINFAEESFNQKLDFSDKNNVDKILKLKIKEKSLRNEIYLIQSKSQDTLSSDEIDRFKKLSAELLTLMKNY